MDHQAPLFKGFYRQEYWSGLPFPSLEDLPNPGIEPGAPTLQVDSLPSELPKMVCLVNGVFKRQSPLSIKSGKGENSQRVFKAAKQEVVWLLTQSRAEKAEFQTGHGESCDLNGMAEHPPRPPQRLTSANSRYFWKRK